MTPSIIEKYMEGKRVVIIFPDAFLATHFLTHTTLIREDMFVLENVLTPRGRIQSWKAIER